MQSALDTTQLAAALDKVPVGITIIDTTGHILYFNAYCTRFVDRKPEYIGRDIRDCHKEAQSIARIDAMLKTLNEGREAEIHYTNGRGPNELAVTVAPFEIEGERIGYIQSFVVKA
jgi:DUF438 domain-containing protein